MIGLRMVIMDNGRSPTAQRRRCPGPLRVSMLIMAWEATKHFAILAILERTCTASFCQCNNYPRLPACKDAILQGCQWDHQLLLYTLSFAWNGESEH